MKWSKYFLDVDSLETYEELFDNLKIYDAHCHLGVDKDGMSLNAKELLAKMDAANIEKSVVFPFNDPRKQKNFEISNDEILKAYQENKDRFIPFFRLNPKKGWKSEFSKRAEQGFAGIKLHPRAQNFELDSAAAKEIYAKAEQHNLMVLAHTGYGFVEVSSKILEITKTFPKLKLILGHSAFVDIEEAIKKLQNKKNVFFETSTIKLFDMYDLMKKLDHKKIIYGSDEPYGQMDVAIETVINVGVACGVKQKYIRDVLCYNLKNMLK